MVILVVVVLAGSAYAFANANTVPGSAAGYASSTVSGYTVSNIVYDLNESNPTLVDAITFSVSPSSGTAEAVLVKVQTDTGGSWKTCSLAAGVAPAVNVTCTYSDPTLALVDVTALNVVASSTTDPAP